MNLNPRPVQSGSKLDPPNWRSGLKDKSFQPGGFTFCLFPLFIFVVAGMLWAGAWIGGLHIDERTKQDNTLDLDVLALRPFSFPPIHDDPFFQEIHDAMQLAYPGQELWYVKGYSLPEPEFERVKNIRYRSYWIFARKSA